MSVPILVSDLAALKVACGTTETKEAVTQAIMFCITAHKDRSENHD